MLLHFPNQVVNVIVHLSHCFDIISVLFLEMVEELLDELFLVLNNLFALILLDFDFLNRKGKSLVNVLSVSYRQPPMTL